jgi:hypothetical protein
MVSWELTRVRGKRYLVMVITWQRGDKARDYSRSSLVWKWVPFFLALFSLCVSFTHTHTHTHTQHHLFLFVFFAWFNTHAYSKTNSFSSQNAETYTLHFHCHVSLLSNYPSTIQTNEQNGMKWVGRWSNSILPSRTSKGNAGNLTFISWNVAWSMTWPVFFYFSLCGVRNVCIYSLKGLLTVSLLFSK